MSRYLLCHLYAFPLLQPHDYMRTINVSCRPASNQLLAYDSHYLHLSRRVIGAQLGLCRQVGLVLVVGVRGEGNVLLDQFCRLLDWLGLTMSNGRSNVTGFVCACVCVLRVGVEEHDGYCMCKGCYCLLFDWCSWDVRRVPPGLKQHPDSDNKSMHVCLYMHVC